MSRAAEAAIAASYKSLKEDFVSNLTGGEIWEINYVTAVAPVSFKPLALDISNLPAGSSCCLVCLAVPPFVLQILRSHFPCRRYSTQCRSYSPCDDTLRRQAPPPQPSPPCASYPHICYASRTAAKEGKIATRKRDESKPCEPTSKEVILDDLSWSHACYHMSGYTRGRFQDISSKICKSGNLGNIIDGHRSWVLCLRSRSCGCSTSP